MLYILQIVAHLVVSSNISVNVGLETYLLPVGIRYKVSVINNSTTEVHEFAVGCRLFYTKHTLNIMDLLQR